MNWNYRLLTVGAGTAAVATALFGGSTFAATVYSDVPPAHWAYTAVQWVAQQGIMVGPDGKPGFFDAAGLVNRAQLAAVVARHNDLLNQKIVDLQSRLSLMEDRLDDLDGGSTRKSSSSTSSRGITAGSFMATLTPGQETFAVVSDGSGQGSFALNGNRLDYDITVSGLTTAITAAHFHSAMPGVAGSPVETITFSGNRATGTWNMTTSERADLLAGRLYVNVHTTRYPDGEIRGQIMSGTSSSSMSGRSSSGSSGRSSSFSSHSSMSSMSSFSSNSSMSNSSLSNSSLSSGASSSFSS